MPEPMPAHGTAAVAPSPLVAVADLKVQIGTDDGLVRAVDGVTFDVPRGRTLCIVGESGSGKSVTGRALMNLLPPSGRIAAGSILYSGRDGEAVDVTKLDPRGRQIRSLRGKEISLISQEPMAALSPVHTIGQQLVPVIRRHLGLSKKAAQARAVEMLGRVGIPRPAERLGNYPFEFSGGMRQRVCIALALSCRPRLLIADEPTTALDVTTQANIIDLLQELQREDGLSILFITHDLGVVAEIADDVAVMYLGKIVERGTVEQIFADPRHPYTRALLKSVPRLGAGRGTRLAAIRGMVPSPFDRPKGCDFHPRCDAALKGICNSVDPGTVTIGPRRDVRCVLAREPAAIGGASHG
ncbi:dipeptide/oligopeptide/nickel ABC transporter ATP-binding protein [Bosea sp. Root483D1]|uniref:ABC transporter ATP-binding protein n=1 Tax=Bosea sp. Root483D1 TaxID=1736544 RepID=UPI00070A97B3|nr:dipeptide/oligopeptide/nickel ABC transporter ATP-binding protein [Bosea sp. Root483D1]